MLSWIEDAELEDELEPMEDWEGESDTETPIDQGEDLYLQLLQACRTVVIVNDYEWPIIPDHYYHPIAGKDAAMVAVSKDGTSAHLVIRGSHTYSETGQMIVHRPARTMPIPADTWNALKHKFPQPSVNPTPKVMVPYTPGTMPPWWKKLIRVGVRGVAVTGLAVTAYESITSVLGSVEKQLERRATVNAGMTTLTFEYKLVLQEFLDKLIEQRRRMGRVYNYCSPENSAAAEISAHHEAALTEIESCQVLFAEAVAKYTYWSTRLPSETQPDWQIDLIRLGEIADIMSSRIDFWTSIADDVVDEYGCSEAEFPEGSEEGEVLLPGGAPGGEPVAN